MSKYNARETHVSPEDFEGVIPEYAKTGYRFDSKAEAQRYIELALLVRAGEITALELQPEYELIPKHKRDGKTVRAMKYKADFRYVDSNGDTVIEDVKGMKTQVYKLKKKLLLWRYPELNFVEVAA